MSTTTKSYTFPAIRALIWERWRVMRWVLLFGCLAYLLFGWALTSAMKTDSDALTISATGTPYERQSEALALVLVFAFPGFFMHPQRNGRWSPRIPLHHFLAPMPKFLLALTQFSVTLAGVSLLFAALLLIDYAFLGSSSLLSNAPVAQWLLIALAYAATIHAWLVLVPVGISALLVVLALAFIPGMWDTGELTPPLLAVRLGVIALGALASVGFYSLTRTNATAVFQMRLPMPELLRPVLRMPSGPGAALAWYERRTWGVSFAGAFVLVAVLSCASLLLKDGTSALSDWLLAILLIAMMFAAAVNGYADMRPSVFQALRPVPTARLALTGILSRSLVLLLVGLAAVLIGIIGVLIDGQTGAIISGTLQHPLDALLIACALFLLAWLALSSFYFTALMVGMVVMFERVAHTDANIALHPQWITAFTFPALFVAAISGDVYFGRLLSWRMAAGLAAGLALASAISAALVIRMEYIPLVADLAKLAPLHYAAIAFLILYYPLIRRIHFVDRWRTNLPAGEFAEKGDD